MHRKKTTQEGIEWYNKVQSGYERTIEMAKKKRMAYCPEFKLEAVKRVTELGERSHKVSTDLGVNPNTIRDWVKTYKEEPFVGSGNLRDKDEENRQLRKRLRDLEEENEILKKATAIFARGHKKSSDS